MSTLKNIALLLRSREHAPLVIPVLRQYRYVGSNGAKAISRILNKEWRKDHLFPKKVWDIIFTLAKKKVG